jgi:acetoin utilization deacetylase AcuC-like enzyme
LLLLLKINKILFSYGYMVQALNKLLPNKVVAVLEGGYFADNYVECAAMMTRGLKVVMCGELS